MKSCTMNRHLRYLHFLYSISWLDTPIYGIGLFFLAVVGVKKEKAGMQLTII